MKVYWALPSRYEGMSDLSGGRWSISEIDAKCKETNHIPYVVEDSDKSYWDG